MSASDFITRLQQYGDRPMIETGGWGWDETYESFLDGVEQRRKELDIHIGQRKVVGMFLHQSLVPFSFVSGDFRDLIALALNKCITIPYYGVDEREGIDSMVEEDTGQRGPGTINRKYPLIEKLKKRNRAGLVVSSTGTTGKPKWVVHDLDSLFAKYLKLKKAHTVPLVYRLDNVSGIELFTSIAAAGGLFLAPGQNIGPQGLSEFLESLKVRADLLSMTPSYLRLLLMSWIPEVYNNVQNVNLGGERLLPADLERFQKALPNARIHSFYGTTESSSIKTETLAGTNYVKWGREGEDFKVVNNELYLRRRSYHMLGYLLDDQPEHTDWYATRDLVALRQNGFYEVIGRKDIQFNVGGKKVDPVRVEQALMQSGNISACKIESEANALLGNIVVARVIAEAGKEVEANLRRHCVEQLPEHARPMKYVFVDSFELNHRLKGN